MKKFSLLVALLLALSFVFFSCGEDPEEAPVWLPPTVTPVIISGATVMANLIAVETSTTFVTVGGQNYVLINNGVSGTISGQTPDEINGFNLTGTARLLYQFPDQGFDNWYDEGYRNLDVGMVVIKTGYDCADACAEGDCTNAAFVGNSGPSLNRLGAVDYPNLANGSFTFAGFFNDEHDLDGFCITKNHSNSALLVRITNVTIY